MFGLASGWRAIDSTALLPMMPSPIADPNAAKPTMSANAMMTADTRMAFSMWYSLLVSVVRGRSDQICGGEEREDDRLDEPDEHVEHVDKDRAAVCQSRDD